MKISSLPNISSLNDENIIATTVQIPQRIEKVRLEAGLTQDAVALKLGIKRSTYQYWEERTPSIKNIKRLEEAMGLPKGYILNDENFVPRETEDQSDLLKVPHYGKRTLSADGINITLQDYIDLLKQQNEEYLGIIKNSLATILVNSTKSLDDLATVQRILRSDDGVIMDNQDEQAGREPGESATKAGTIEISSAIREKEMGNKEAKRK